MPAGPKDFGRRARHRDTTNQIAEQTVTTGQRVNLHTAMNTVVLPDGWTRLISESSVTFTDPKRSTHIKCLSSGAIHVDFRVKGFWQSEVHPPGSQLATLRELLRRYA